MPASPRRKRPPSTKERRQERRPRVTPPTLAKISPPLITTVFERKRLYKVLDDADRRPVSFFTAPAGAGKTMLAASYLKARHRPCLWLQLETDNADPASFVYYLRMAAQRLAPRRAAKLPLLTAEYQLGLPTFARHLFGTLAQVVPADTVLVIDNYQEVGADATLHEFLAEGLAALPSGMRLLCLSRQAPPAALARRRAEGAVALLEWDTLRFTLEEAAALAKLQCGKRAAPSPAALQQLHARTHGWAAGLMLLLESAGTAVSGPGMEQGGQTTFDYLASEVFQRLDPAMRELLPPLAIPPAVSAAMAAELTGHPHAGQRLEELVRANCFTTLHSSGHYQFHPLFRNFLLNELQSSKSGADRQSLQRSAANLLVDEDQPEEAAQLFIEAEDWAGLAELIAENAQGLITQGRHLTLANWFNALPQEMHGHSPWLAYWQGMCELARHPPRAVDLFTKSYVDFEARKARIGQGLSIAGAMDAIYIGQGDQSAHDDWIVRFEKLIAHETAFPTAEIEGRIWASVIWAVFWRKPNHPRFNEWLMRMEDVWARIRDANTRLHLGSNLIQPLGTMGRHAKVSWWVRNIEQLLRSKTSTAPISTITFHLQHAYVCAFFGNTEGARQSVREALAHAETTGVHILDALALAPAIYADLLEEDLASADAKLTMMGNWLATIPENLDTAHYEFLLGWRAHIAGELTVARHHAEHAVRITRRIGAAYPASLCRYGLAHVLIGQGDYDAAIAEINKARLNTGAASAWMSYLCDMLLSYLEFRRGHDDAGLRRLHTALIRSRDGNFSHSLWFRREIMADLYARAIEANIEPEHCRALIAAHRLAPPDSSRFAEHWPFPVRIRTLGNFQLLKDGQPLRFEGKPPRKPLEMLKVLIALGGRDVRDERLSTILWPDAAGDAAQSAFTTTLARLRKLLGGDDTLVVQDGRVSLNPDHCWLDTWALEAQIATIERAPLTVGAAAPVLGLYRGAFLEQESDAVWALPARERLRSRFLRFLTHEARRLGAAGHREQAVTLFLQGLEIDPLIEDFYRGLMTAYGELGRQAEALAAFERCRTLLARTLGVEPGVETRTLAERLRRP